MAEELQGPLAMPEPRSTGNAITIAVSEAAPAPIAAGKPAANSAAAFRLNGPSGSTACSPICAPPPWPPTRAGALRARSIAVIRWGHQGGELLVGEHRRHQAAGAAYRARDG